MDARELFARTSVKLAAFALAVAATIAGGAIIGAAIGPDNGDEPVTNVTLDTRADGSGHDGH